MKIAIVGSRSFSDYSALSQYIKETIDITEVEAVVSGGANGADSLAERFAKDEGKQLLIFHPQWKKYGKQAGMLRNTQIVDKADIVFAFWDGVSRGTKDSIDKATNRGKKVYVYTFKP